MTVGELREALGGLDSNLFVAVACESSGVEFSHPVAFTEVMDGMELNDDGRSLSVVTLVPGLSQFTVRDDEAEG